MADTPYEHRDQVGENTDEQRIVPFESADGEVSLSVNVDVAEQEAAARFRMGASGMLYAYCNRHGLFNVRTPRRERSVRQAS